MRRQTLPFLAVLAFSSLAQAANPVPLPDSMGALGDSITAGALAAFRRQDLQNPLIALRLMPELLAYVTTGRVRAMENPEDSWASGTNPFVVNSHATRLHRLRKWRPMRIHNASISGDTSGGLLREQVPELMDWSRRRLGQEAPDYVTILIGPNDVCVDEVSRMVPTAEFVANVAAAVDQLTERSPRTRVLISAIPNIESLRRVAKDARHLGGAPFEICEDFWKVARFCPSLTLESDPEKRAQLAQRVREYNEGLAWIAARSPDDRVRFAPDAYGIAFTADHVSIDCFHPNPEGHELLSEQAWKSTWWK